MTTTATLARPPSSAPGSPAATRLRRRGWRDPRLAVGVALVSLSVVIGARLLGTEDTVEVWALAGDRAAGQVLGAGDVVTASVRFAGPQQADRYLPGAVALPEGLVLARDVSDGELLPRSAVAETDAAPLVEVPLTVSADAVPESVVPGSLVDVWVVPGQRTDGTPARRAVRALTGVPVLAAPSAAAAMGAAAERQVVVGVASGSAGRDAPDLARVLARLARGTVVVTGRADR